MGFFDFFSNLNWSSINTKFNLNNKNDIKPKIENAKNPVVTIERNIHINNVLTNFHTVKSGMPKITSPRTIRPAHDKCFLRNGIKARHVDAFELKYNGLLAQSGADRIFAKVGYGSNDSWEEEENIQLFKIGHRTFRGYIPMKKHEVNIAFNDGSGNWDNNSGQNYSYNGKLLKIVSQSNSNQ